MIEIFYKASALKTILLTLIALIAFAGNSVLCRLALYDDVIDPVSFTSLRLLSGIIFLFLLFSLQSRDKIYLKGGSWTSSFYLFIYALSFSFAYISLDTGTGALILFAFVQVTMIITGLVKGQRLIFLEWLGLCLAFIGLTLLLLPGASAPPLLGFTLMAISGIAWGFYTLAGQGSQNPLNQTLNNFVKTLPFVLVLCSLAYEHIQLSEKGIILAVVSGALTSGLGYAIWYAALKNLSITNAAIIQLSVPIISAFGGVIFLDEIISKRLIICSILVLGGVLLVIVGKRYMYVLRKT